MGDPGKKESWEEYAEKLTPVEATSSGTGVVNTGPIATPANPDAVVTTIIPDAPVSTPVV